MRRGDFCRLKHKGWIVFSGIVWLFMGLFLLWKGLRFLSEIDSTYRQIGLFLALLLGILKGRMVFQRSSQRIVKRILALPLPISPWKVYPLSYWLLIGFMMGLGMAFRFLPLSVFYRGLIDVAIGSALIQGSFFYFRSARDFVKNYF